LITLVIYDITDDELRNKVASFLRMKGLKRVQKSAFLGDLTHSERVNMEAGVRRLIKDSKANVQVYPLTPACYSQRSVIGVEMSYDEEEFLV